MEIHKMSETVELTVSVSDRFFEYEWFHFLRCRYVLYNFDIHVIAFSLLMEYIDVKW